MMSKRNHENNEQDATRKKIPKLLEEELRLKKESPESKNGFQYESDESENDSQWETEESDSSFDGEDEGNETDDVGPSSVLRVENDKSEGEPTQPPDPVPEDDKKTMEPKRPKTSHLIINPTNYKPPDKGERSQPSSFYTHSDEDSDKEGRPKEEFSEERIKNNHGPPKLKRPPKKNTNTMTQVPHK